MAVGGVIALLPGQREARFLGTCFALRRPDHFVTAKHILRGSPGELRVAFGAQAETAVVDIDEVVVHDRVDLAVLRASGPRRYVPKGGTPGPQQPSREVRELAHFVDDVASDEVLTGVWYESYGLPTDLPSQLDRGGVGEGRCFRGYIRRAMTFSGGWGTYRAVELSEGVPGGASGAPIYDPNDKRRVIAMATTTFESEIPGQTAEDDGSGSVVATGAKSMTWRVGVGLVLAAHRPWLDEHISPLA